MAEARIRVVAVPPGADGLLEGLRSAVRPESWVAAYHDPTVKTVSEFLATFEESAEAMSFADLVGRVLRVLGLSTDRVATRGQREAMASLACDALTGETIVERSASLPGMPALIESRLEELRHFGVEPDDLKRLAPAMPVPLQEKLDAMIRVAELIKDSMEVSHRAYVTDRVRACLDTDEADLAAVRHVVAVAGGDERPLFDAFLGWLTGRGVDVDMVVSLVPERTDLFLPAQRSAARCGAKSRKVIGEKPWCAALFSPSIADRHPEVRVNLAPDPLAECEWILRECARLNDSGHDFGSIGVFVRDAEQYTPFLIASGRRLQVPLHCSRTVPLLSCGLAGTVLRALKAIAGRDVRHVARLAFGTYFPTPHETADDLLGLAKATWRHGAAAWSMIGKWIDERPDPVPWLGALVDWRESHAGKSFPLSRWLEDFRTLVGETGVWEAASSGPPDVMARDERAQTVLQRSLADHAFVYDQAGMRELSLSGFVALAEKVWEEETVTFESGQGGVRVSGDVESLPPLQTLFVPGMLEGTLPRRRKEDPLLHDEDREKIASATGNFLPRSRDTARAERDLFVRVCAAASDRIVFSYPLTDDDRENVPAFFLDELERAVGGRMTRTVYSRAQFAPEAAGCLTEADALLRSSLDGPRVFAGPVKVDREGSRRVLRPDWDDGVSADELQSAAQCAFQAAFRYRLRVRPPDRAIGTAVLSDLPRKAGLAASPDAVSAKHRLRQELDSLLDDLSVDMADWELGLLRATGLRWIDGWVEREFRSRELWPRTAGSVHTDVGLDSAGLRGDPKVAGRKIRLKARVAAVYDVAGVSVVQDYSPTDPELRDLADSIENSGERLKTGLLLLAQTHRSAQGIGVEVDGGFGRRILGFTPPTAAVLRGDAATQLSVCGLGPRGTLVNRVFERLEAAVGVVERSDARATPGKACEACPYGDLCRKSSVFGAEDSPFGGDESR